MLDGENKDSSEDLLLKRHFYQLDEFPQMEVEDCKATEGSNLKPVKKLKRGRKIKIVDPCDYELGKIFQFGDVTMENLDDYLFFSPSKAPKMLKN